MGRFDTSISDILLCKTTEEVQDTESVICLENGSVDISNDTVGVDSWDGSRFIALGASVGAEPAAFWDVVVIHCASSHKSFYFAGASFWEYLGNSSKAQVTVQLFTGWIRAL
ncbi:MAG: hypothetical protein EB078_11350 [Proteobacteria bacterium]|nr:hypothetical protein [Pseudomonadota bacterium]